MGSINMSTTDGCKGPKLCSSHIAINLAAQIMMARVIPTTLSFRTWRTLTSHAEEVWKTFYVRRWGPDEERTGACSSHGSWKSAFEHHDRLDRVGPGWGLVREGRDIYITNKGELLHLLSTTSCGQTSSDELPFANRSSMSRDEDGAPSEISEEPSSGSRAGLVDKMFEVLADLNSELHKASKRPCILRD